MTVYHFKRKCPVCSCGLGICLGELNFSVFDSSPIKGHFSLAACERCGLVFYDAPLTNQQVEQYYAGNRYYISAQTVGTGGLCRFEAAHHEQIALCLDTYLNKRKQEKIFDVGCGQGGLLSTLKEMGYGQLYGVDLLPEAVDFVRRHLSIEAACSSAFNLPFGGTQAGAIIFSHVLEHAFDPVSILSEAKKRLKSDGIIYIEVPDASSYPHDIPYQELYLEHLNHFSSYALAYLLKRNGFHILELKRSIFKINDKRSLPVLRVVASHSKDSDKNLYFSKGEAIIGIGQYLDYSETHPAIKTLSSLALANQKIWVWGISQLTMLLLGGSPLTQIEILGLLDRDPYKMTQKINGLPIQSPDILSGRPNNEGLLLAAWNHEDSMRQNLSKLDFHGPVWALSCDI